LILGYSNITKENIVDISTSLEWAELLKAIAHPTRLQIVGELLKGTKCVTVIQDIVL
jgi:ArsR family transcriptional regulator